ncbi:MAG: prepilin-type N-terminal cleavage/methylation domain-containing protein [Bacilli bacterium]|nr:prepilin-type N-terminal cleavage/methylation domain-containing protein [Bacilli bacterium]MDD4706567.1 prepilin-type N-terminal cleavage/methylation domain-containing protein [Bacilli bacterium]
MKMNKKGFTLIELLAVIVILSIIMLIATPAIVGVIEEARQGAAKNSALGYIDAIEKHVMIQELKGSADLQNATIDESTDIPHRGNKPDAVDLSVINGAVTNGTIQFGDYIFEVNDGVVSPSEES